MADNLNTSELASWVTATHDGTWRVVWRGTPVDRSFPTRDLAWAHLEGCDEAGEILP